MAIWGVLDSAKQTQFEHKLDMSNTVSLEVPRRRPATKLVSDVRTAAYFSWSSLTPLMSGWDRILKNNPTLSIFSTPEWLKSWWEAFGANRRLLILAISDPANTLIGLVPLYWENLNHPLFPWLKQLRFVGDGSGDSDNLDFIIQPGEEHRCIAAFIRWFTEQRACGICSLNTLPENSTAAQILASQIEAANWPFRRTMTPNSAVPLPSTWESYIEGLSPKFRRLIIRCRARLESQYDVRFRRCEDSAEIPQMLNTLYRLHRKRWNSVNQPGSFGSVERRDLYVRMARAFFDRRWLELWCLELNGKPVAAQMSFRYRDRVYGLQEGFDTEFFSHHVGHVLRAGMLEYFVRTGAKAYDFLGGFNAQKQRWGAELGAYTNLQFATPWSVASCCLALDKGAAATKGWLRSYLPSAAWNVLHRMKVSCTHKGNTVPESSTSGFATNSMEEAALQ